MHNPTQSDVLKPWLHYRLHLLINARCRAYNAAKVDTDINE